MYNQGEAGPAELSHLLQDCAERLKTWTPVSFNDLNLSPCLQLQIVKKIVYTYYSYFASYSARSEVINMGIVYTTGKHEPTQTARRASHVHDAAGLITSNTMISIRNKVNGAERNTFN